MKVIILGLSRFGVQFAKAAAQHGHQIVVIDRSTESFDRLPGGFKATEVLGIGIDTDVMRKAGMDQAGLFLAATDSDNTNLMAAQVAKVVFNVKRSVARVHDDARGDVFRELGLIEVICPTLDAARALSQSLNSGT